MPVAWWRGGALVVPVAAAIVIVAIGVTMASRRAPSPAPVLASRPVAWKSAPFADARPVRPRTAPEHSAVPARQRVAIVAAGPDEPQVLVPREELDMYRRLIAEAQRLPHAMVIDGPPVVVAASGATDITIDPIKIELIVPPAGGEGDRK
jgi:hypothetical protein